MDNQTLVVLAAAVALFYAWRLFGPGRKASSKLVAAKLEAGASVIDVRTPSEFCSGSYPGAKNIPLDKLNSKLKSLGAKDDPLVVYCASGSRSAQAAKILKAAGFTDVLNGGPLHSMPLRTN